MPKTWRVLAGVERLLPSELKVHGPVGPVQLWGFPLQESCSPLLAHLRGSWRGMPLQRSHLTLCFEGGGLQLVWTPALALVGEVGGEVAGLLRET